MRSTALPIHPGLAGNGRLPALPKEGQWSDTIAMATLFGAGVIAGMTTLLIDSKMQIPGNAILRAVFPMALGLSLAPRRMGGMVMATGALSSVMAIKLGGFATLGFGATTSLMLAGPALDAALWRARRGWRLYLAFAMAGLGANLIALAMRAGGKLMGFDRIAAKPFGIWWVEAIGTYTACGLAAGLLGALVWFQFSSKKRDQVDAETTT